MAGALGSIQLLGPVIVQIDGIRVSHFRSHKTLALLAYLIVENRPLARDFLAEIFWPDSTIAVSRGHLRRALYDLVHKLPGWINLDHDIVSFNNSAEISVDLYLIEGSGASAHHPSPENMLEVPRGEFLEGISLVDCPQVEHWLWSEREKWRHRTVEMIEQRCGQFMQASQYDRALDCSWKLVKLQPWREDRYRNLMILLVRNGDVAMALKIFTRCRHALAVELEMEPAAETLVLYKRIRKLLTQTPTNPTANDSLSRSWELDALIHDIISPHHRLVTITGADLDNKNCLMRSIDGRVNGPTGYFFIDGVFLVSLEGCFTVDMTIAELSHSLRITAARKSIPLSLILKYLQDKELLLLLTNLAVSVEHRDLLATILEAVPAIKIVVTALEAFHLPQENVLALDHAPASFVGEANLWADEGDDPHQYLGLLM